MQLARRVQVIADPEIDAGGESQRHAIRMEVVLRDGRILKAARSGAKGSSAKPLTVAEIETKFERLASSALSPAQVSTLKSTAYRSDELQDVRQLSQLLVPNLM